MHLLVADGVVGFCCCDLSSRQSLKAPGCLRLALQLELKVELEPS